MDGLLSLKWSNHQSTFIHTLRSLRNKELYTDATLACDGKFYSVHKLVLSTCSDYFSAMLDRTNCKNPVIVLKDIKCEDLEALLDYMYLGEVNVQQHDLSTLIKAAECLHVKGLAVPDDACQPRKNKRTDNPYKSEDVSGSPSAKKGRSDDGKDDSLSRQESRPSVVHSSFSKHKRRCHVSLSPLRSSTAAQEEASHKETLSNGNDHTEDVQIEQAGSLVKIEMDDSENDIEEYNHNIEGGLKEEQNKTEITEAGDDRGDISSDLPDCMQQASTGPPHDTFEHSSFSDSNFQSSDIHGWQSDGSNIGFPLLDIGSSEPGQQKASIVEGDCNSFANASCSGTAMLLPSGVTDDNWDNLCGGSDISQNDPLQSSQCSMCSKVFHGAKRKYSLDRHMLTHTGDRPYKCTFCPYRACRKEHLNRHVKSQHAYQK